MPPNSRIWLIGGTQESREIAIALAQCQIPTIITVTTASAEALYPQQACLQVWIGRLGSETLPTFLQQQGIAAIVDASHPFAVGVSETAIAVAHMYQIPYLRYERPLAEAIGPSQVKPPLTNSMASPSEAHTVITVDSLEAVLQKTVLAGERVLLTLGYRWLHAFQPWHSTTTLFARILPSSAALEAALAAGFTPDRLIALRPPISPELERALWQQWQITTVVTKASGVPGGEPLKRQLAAELGIRLIVITRPRVAYPQTTQSLTTVLEFCQPLGAGIN